MEVKDNLSKAKFELMEELKLVLTMDKKAEQSNVYRTYQEDEHRGLSQIVEKCICYRLYAHKICSRIVIPICAFF